MMKLWDEVKRQLRSDLTAPCFSLWINPIEPLDEKEGELVLGCPNKFSMNWVTENYRAMIEEKLDSLAGGRMRLTLKVAPPAAEANSPHPRQRQLRLPHIPGNGRNGSAPFNPDFTFDRFVVGRSNEFAYSASRALAQPGFCDYNTLLMLANTGLGKSHLSQAVGNAIVQSNPQCRVRYVTAEDFANEMIAALKSRRVEEFKNKYRRSCDVLLLDEVHFLSGKEKIQAEVGYTLDALANDKKKIIFTSAMAPKKIPRLSRELTSRLTCGLVTTIDKPDFDTRVKILEKKAREQNLTLSEEIIHHIAGRLTRDVRQMESVLRCLKARSELLKARLDLDLTREVISCLVSPERIVSLEDVRDTVCRYFKVDPETLRSKSRKKIHALPRNIYIYLCRRHVEDTLETIAQSVNRSHSTALYASEVIEKRLKSDGSLRRQVRFLSEKLEEKRK
ncbi:MAG: chromosomal replication initiator protein DnaA [Deltaproteobacteria bacterium]|nr:chromosomal replication initiator protein DnaA [Deltaproteobacteria bacterium]MBW1922382.1 chromosomal replication initiator protein DnaA [Deltaproteobacteria bacterium]MBW1948418.1 chromosomal replication initiator protein DnaA [Deltaproteobacteria bacterium]MBW2347418.1 chromosomal replication initiator protein DnaA [Deltaproteobacteria bacterium]